jgi:serine/threonine-protein kinase HipA
LLTRGAGNPPGNLRIREAAAASLSNVIARHPGFSRSEVLERATDFLEYARMHGAAVAGGSGAGGDAPKFLLREDHDGRFHADGALEDAHTARAWLVKFPRSPRSEDRMVLEAEAGYLRVAGRCGVRTGAALSWERDTLFVPRFERIVEVDGHVARLGMESLCSLAGVAAFGAAIPKERLARALSDHVTRAAHEDELREFLLRDVLDLALGNTDNHARNTAVLKDEAGVVRLSPLFDFAPMFLDTQGIARVCRWQSERAALPDWSAVLDSLQPLGLDRSSTLAWLRGLEPMVRDLPRVLVEEGVPAAVVARCQAFVARTADSLESVR